MTGGGERAAELKELERNLEFPLFIDLILLADRLDAHAHVPAVDDVEVLAAIRIELCIALGRRGIQTILAEGFPPDPALHEVISWQHTGDPRRDGVVIREAWRGYRCGDVVIRRSGVIVGRYEGARR